MISIYLIDQLLTTLRCGESRYSGEFQPVPRVGEKITLHSVSYEVISVEYKLAIVDYNTVINKIIIRVE